MHEGQGKDKRNLVGKILGGIALVGILGGYTYYMVDGIRNINSIHLRTNSIMQSGYVSPKKLDIKLTDIDKNGEKEVVLEYDFRRFLLMEDENGNPVLRKYKIKPEEKVPVQYTAPEILY